MQWHYLNGWHLTLVGPQWLWVFAIAVLLIVLLAFLAKGFLGWIR